jgi:two-component system cell cycle sensor histidine kinase/response regulator CckA
MSSDSAAHTVLIADDERDTVDTTAVMLEGSGYRVLRAYSAKEALILLDDHPEIALLVSDIRMPDVDGFDLLRVVRHRFGSLPVVLITGLPVTDDDVVPMGAEILTKPFSFEELTGALSAKLASAGNGAGR